MNVKEREVLTQSVEKLMGCQAVFDSQHQVAELFEGQMVWQGEVGEFSLMGHEQSDRCYAWSSFDKERNKRKFYAVLAIDPIDSPSAAVRAAIIRDFKVK